MAFSVHRIKRKRRKRKERRKKDKEKPEVNRQDSIGFFGKDWKVWFERGKKDQNINNALLLRDFLHLIFF
jgi:hypothetical protein